MGYEEAMSKIEARVKEAILGSGQKKIYVRYSAYGTTSSGIPIDNLDKVAYKGKCSFFTAADPFWGGREGRHYQSEIVANPTRLQLCVLANAMIKRTKDSHHYFLEGIEPVELSRVRHDRMRIGPLEDEELLSFLMGS